MVTTSFGEYSRYYDLLYADKDYAAEAGFARAILEAHGCGAAGRRLLDLGCGTGRHARRLAAGGDRVHGVDLSPGMIARARVELANEPPEVQARTTFAEGDLRTYRAGETFDAVLSLFHVMSYQTAQEDLEGALATARAHLATGGVFLFDAWYGPGVLTDPPAVRVKRVAGPEHSVLRLSEPTLLPTLSCVDVAFTLFAFDRTGAVVDQTRETHRMRYWFHPEIDVAARRAGFEVLELGEWMTRRPPQASTWNAYWVLRATGA